MSDNSLPNRRLDAVCSNNQVAFDGLARGESACGCFEVDRGDVGFEAEGDLVLECDGQVVQKAVEVGSL